jgi:ribosomal protein S4
MALVKEGLARGLARPMPPYVKVNKPQLSGALTSIPKRDQIPVTIDEGLVVEHYARYI